MPMLSEDDFNIRDLSDEELGLAWDLWADLAQTANDDAIDIRRPPDRVCPPRVKPH